MVHDTVTHAEVSVIVDVTLSLRADNNHEALRSDRRSGIN
jgi:hypothetical protein